MAEIFSTICALATPPGLSAIAVIRVSGREAFSIVERIFLASGKEKRLSHLPAQKLIPGEIIDPEAKELIDKVLLATYHSPHSYTGEDMVEIFCHGGFYCPERIISLLLRYGCRQALPGEFTKRRFLAGKIDLAQAEGIMALTSARTELQAQAALKQMKGYLSQRMKEMVGEMKELLAEVENEIEFSEKESDFLECCRRRLEKLKERIEELVKKGEKEVFIQKGVKCPIVGKANVGKSSLFNRLLGKERALVTEIPGTTRDAISETISLKGIPFRLIDTCGFRVQREKLEELGWEKTEEYLREADLVIVVLDHSQPLTEEDYEIIRLTAQKKRVIVRNKSDLPPHLTEGEEILPPPLPISCKEGTGIEELKELLARQFLNGEEEFYLSEFRHHDLLRRAAAALGRAQKEPYWETIAYEIKSAINSLAEITGEVTSEEILDRIFSRFCIGK
ncbi:MAG: tRNA uridine-5-carboxymethylaminomethyl(34) synthesis GTPase MnmE [candidate division WOR-3 bacterium]